MILGAVAALAIASAPEAGLVAEPPVPAAAPGQIPVDTMIALEVAEPVSTRTIKPGDTFAIRLAAPITYEGRVVAPAGTPGRGQVVDAARAGILGKPAKLVLAARYIELNGKQTPLRAFRWAKAGDDMTNVIMVTSFIPYAGMLSLFIQGGEIDVPVGATALAKLAAPIDVSPAPAASQTAPEVH